MLVVYTLTIFLSAGLLFLVQPMVTKLILPLLGGSPAVWNTAMVFFQAVLLAGYAYAHGISARLSAKWACVIHTLVVLVPLIALPIALPEGWEAPTEGSPIPSLLAILAVIVGLPFFVLSTTGPILQRWFATTDHPSAADPYFLYAASNTGSLLALLSFPFLLEPLLPMKVQSIAWSVGYCLFVLLMITSAALLLFRRRSATAHPTRPDGIDTINARTRALWILLAFVPSSLMLGVTHYLSTDVAAVPLLWVIPLAIYLLTFILAFAKRSEMLLKSASKLLPIIALALAAAFLLGTLEPITILIPLHLIGLFFGAMVCHGRLAAIRPHAAHLTEFYLLMSLGGVLGGVFNALVAPLVFDLVLEYPIAIVLACLFRPATTVPASTGQRRNLVLDLALPIALLGLMLGSQKLLGLYDMKVSNDPTLPTVWYNLFHVLFSIGLPILVCFLFINRPIRFALATAVLLFVAAFSLESYEEVIQRKRTFFGVYSVELMPVRNLTDDSITATVNLFHGTTLHGYQYYHGTDPQRAAMPVGYHHFDGPLGQVFEVFNNKLNPDRVAVLGLGAGTVAAYGKPGQRFTFYEIDRAIVDIAENHEWFTYLRDCRAEVEPIRIGDGRLVLSKEEDGVFGLIILDAFTSDAVPVHLLTKEAIEEVYLAKLQDDGLIAFNITNRHVALAPVLAAVAGELDLLAMERLDYYVSAEAQAEGRAPTHWVVFARHREAFAGLINAEGWRPLLPRPGDRFWTDDFSDIISVLQWWN